jgi:predicted DNA-binding ribbon-helix-helix protein
MLVKKRSVVLHSRKTSISLEEPFWCALKKIAAFQDKYIGQLISEIDAGADLQNLSSKIRVFVLEYYRKGAERPAVPDTPAT